MGVGEPKPQNSQHLPHLPTRNRGRVSKNFFKRNVDSQEVTKNSPKRSIELFPQLPQTTKLQHVIKSGNLTLVQMREYKSITFYHIYKICTHQSSQDIGLVHDHKDPPRSIIPLPSPLTPATTYVFHR